MFRSPQFSPSAKRRQEVEVSDDLQEVNNNFQSNKRQTKLTAISQPIEWSESVRTCLEGLTTFTPLTEDIDQESFSPDKKQANRFTLKTRSDACACCKKIFPWFLVDSRYRQVLAENPESGFTLGEVIDAMNYLFRRTFTSEDVAILREIYEAMEPPTSGCLKPIVSVQRKFVKKLEDKRALGAGSAADVENKTSIREFRRKTIEAISNLSSMIERNCQEIGSLSALGLLNLEQTQRLIYVNQELQNERARLMAFLQ
jgi:hypothetical protein